MNSAKLVRVAALGFGLVFGLPNCASSNGSNSATGGTTSGGASGGSGSGGSAHGGTTGSGSATASGGSSTSSGGTTASGGQTASGGATHSGGTSSTGGMNEGGNMGMGSGTMGEGGTAVDGGAGSEGGTTSSSATGGSSGDARGMAGMMGRGGHSAGGATGSAVSTGSGGSSGSMTLTSPDQAEGAKFGTEYTCAAQNGTFGAGVNPELDWSGTPDGTQSFAITFIDTKIGANQAMGQHWAIWNIPPTVHQFPKGTTTLSGELMGAMQTNKYLAPCPSGNDTYEFTLYALTEAQLNVSGASGSGTSNSAGVAKVLTALQAIKPLATATLHGTSGPKGQ